MRTDHPLIVRTTQSRSQRRSWSRFRTEWRLPQAAIECMDGAVRRRGSQLRPPDPEGFDAGRKPLAEPSPWRTTLSGLGITPILLSPPSILRLRISQDKTLEMNANPYTDWSHSLHTPYWLEPLFVVPPRGIRKQSQTLLAPVDVRLLFSHGKTLEMNGNLDTDAFDSVPPRRPFAAMRARPCCADTV